jgi:hypothetical protein
MADWTAITGIVVSGVAGPGIVAYFAERRLGREQRHKLQQIDRGELRSLLDTAAQDLRLAQSKRAAVQSAVRQHGSQFGNRGTPGLDELETVGRRIDVTDERVAILLGPDSDGAAAHHEALEALSSTYQSAAVVAAMGVNADLERGWNEIKDAHDAFEDARSRFVAAAHRAAGARLD